jgi:D-alanyl-lipoteichoic acid acyltransferase DltB (MBOAT superfamily)
VSILSLLILISVSLAIGYFAHGRWRSWTLLVVSILVIYWLQPSTPIRHLDFWLPTSSLILTIFAWILTRSKEATDLRNTLTTAIVVSIVILLIGSTRYLGDVCCLTPTRPPEILQILILTFLITILGVLAARFTDQRTGWIYALSIVILVMFIFLKSEPLAKLASMGLRSINGQSAELATAFDIRWLGFSYVAFRLLHTLRDRLSGRLPELTLQEYVIYIIFFPAITAGPIDRIQRFTQNLRQPSKLSLEKTLHGGRRIFVGIFRKFVLADGLAIFALSSMNASQVTSTGWLWIMFYAYALRIYFDFSGYTDIAIGIGNLLGFQLPENFEKPYFKQNLTLFWNSWHMTPGRMVQGIFFNPLTRALRSQPRNMPLPLIIFIGQLSTFILIGLWHGIT